MTEEIRIIGRIITNSFYDYQQVRIGMLNKVRDVIRKKVEGIAFNEVEKKKKKGKKGREKKYTDKELLEKWEQLLKKKKISKKEYSYLITCFGFAKDSNSLENKMKKMMLEYVSSEKVYKKFLSKVRGIGPILSANLIKEFGNCERYDTVSRLWAHSGNHVVDGKAVKLRKGVNITYSPRLRTLTWKISDCLMKQNKAFYRSIYDSEKEKQLGRKYKKGELEKVFGKPYVKKDVNLRLGHAHNRALRKMRKIFLDHYWHVSRELAGLPAKKNYVEGVLEHKHVVTWKRALKREKLAEK